MLAPAQTRRSYWKRVVAINAMSTLVAFSMSRGLESPTWSELWMDLFVNAVFVNCIGTLASVCMPWVARHTRRARPATRWLLRFVALTASVAGGTFVAATFFLLMGTFSVADYLKSISFAGWPLYAFPMVVIISLGIFLYEDMRRELEATTLALRTKERDEALARQAAVEAQLASLESRVQPHFLFNTLNSIAELIHHDPAGAERMVLQLGSLLRSSLDHDAVRLTPLADELRVVRDYLDIESVRLGSRLRYDVRMSDAAATVPVPPLSVQTLVENAVKYAVAPRPEGAVLGIIATAANGRARIEVTDDGPGFGPEAVTNGHGLALLRSRLAMQFGDKASLEIESRPGSTSVAMELPAEDRSMKPTPQR